MFEDVLKIQCELSTILSKLGQLLTPKLSYQVIILMRRQVPLLPQCRGVISLSLVAGQAAARVYHVIERHR